MLGGLRGTLLEALSQYSQAAQCFWWGTPGGPQGGIPGRCLMSHTLSSPGGTFLVCVPFAMELSLLARGSQFKGLQHMRCTEAGFHLWHRTILLATPGVTPPPPSTEPGVSPKHVPCSPKDLSLLQGVPED